jgi:hypothetical protein
MFTVPRESYFLRQAATLLRFAKQTGDPKLAAGLLDKAASLMTRLKTFRSRTWTSCASARRGAANVICDGFSVAEQENTRPSRLRSLQTT